MVFEIVMAHKSNTLPLRVPYILLAFTDSAPLAVKVLPNRAAHSQLGAIRSSRARKRSLTGPFQACLIIENSVPNDYLAKLAAASSN